MPKRGITGPLTPPGERPDRMMHAEDRIDVLPDVEQPLRHVGQQQRIDAGQLGRGFRQGAKQPDGYFLRPRPRPRPAPGGARSTLADCSALSKGLSAKAVAV